MSWHDQLHGRSVMYVLLSSRSKPMKRAHQKDDESRACVAEKVQDIQINTTDLMQDYRPSSCVETEVMFGKDETVSDLDSDPKLPTGVESRDAIEEPVNCQSEPMDTVVEKILSNEQTHGDVKKFDCGIRNIHKGRIFR